MSSILKKENDISKKPILGLISIVIGSIIFKLIFFPLEIPIALDGLDYYFFAMDVNISSGIPGDYSPSKIGWPFLLGVIFNLIPSTDTFFFMEIQKLSTIIISSLTAIPIFFLSNIFFPKKYGLVAALIFVCDPRVGINSSLGITDPFFVILLATSLVLFLSKKEILVYISFFTVGIASIVRPEGLFLFFPLSILYFIKYRKNGIQNVKYLICLLIFFVTILPFITYQENIHGNDLLFDRVENTASFHTQDPQQTNGDSGIPFIQKGLENFPKYLGWVLIPNFIIFTPIGVFLSLKKMNFNKFSLFLSGIFLSIPIFYAYSIPVQDTRYLLSLYPLFSIWAVFTVKQLEDKFRIPIFIPIILIIVLSSIFLITNYDLEYESEAIEISELIHENTMIVNNFYPHSKYLESINIPKTNEELKQFSEDREKGESLRQSVPRIVKELSISEIYSVDELILVLEKEDISHLIIHKEDTSELFLDIYNNENKYPFLKKINDETVYKKIPIKIFEINFNDF